MLPMPEYTHPEGTLNMVSYLEESDIRPDLGPKGYVAMGRWAVQAAVPSCMHLCGHMRGQPGLLLHLSGGAPVFNW
jgi:hypothetical protein